MTPGISADYLRSPYCMKEFCIAQATKKLLAVAVEPVADILAVDVGAYPHVRAQASPEILGPDLRLIPMLVKLWHRRRMRTRI